MIQPKPVSVKFTDETREQIQRLATSLGYSRNQVIVEIVESVLQLIAKSGKETLPRIILLGRAALNYEQNPPMWAQPPQSQIKVMQTAQALLIRKRSGKKHS